MGDGLQIINDASTLQIDGKFRNMCLDNVTTGTTFQHTLNNIRAFKPVVDGTPFHVRCYCTDNVNCYYALNTDVSSYNFGWNVPSAPTGGGLEVYDGAGVLVFSSAAKPLKVLDFVSMNISGVSGSVIFSKTYAGKKVAIVPSQIPFNWERNNQNIRGYSPIFTINGATVSVTYGVADEWYADRGSLTGSANRNDVFQPYMNFLVVDVTNL